MKTIQKILIGIFIGLIALLIQSSALKFLLPDHTVPNFCLVFVVFLAFNEVSITGAVLVFLLGLIFDLSSGVLLGPWAGAFAGTYTILCLISRRVFLDSIPAAFLIILIGSYLSNLLYISLAFQFRVPQSDWVSNLIESSITAAIGPIVLGVFYSLLVRRWSVFASRGSGTA